MARRTLVTCQRVSQKHLENHWHGWATCIVWTIVKCFTTLEPQSHKICILLHTWLPTEHHLREEGAGPRDCPGPLLVSPNLVSWEFFKGQRNTRQRIPSHPVTQIQAFPGIFQSKVSRGPPSGPSHPLDYVTYMVTWSHVVLLSPPFLPSM